MLRKPREPSDIAPRFNAASGRTRFRTREKGEAPVRSSGRARLLQGAPYLAGIFRLAPTGSRRGW
jgi:hypothetical protein